MMLLILTFYITVVIHRCTNWQLAVERNWTDDSRVFLNFWRRWMANSAVYAPVQTLNVCPGTFQPDLISPVGIKHWGHLAKCGDILITKLISMNLIFLLHTASITACFRFLNICTPILNLMVYWLTYILHVLPLDNVVVHSRQTPLGCSSRRSWTPDGSLCWSGRWLSSPPPGGGAGTWWTGRDKKDKSAQSRTCCQSPDTKTRSKCRIPIHWGIEM